ncbi:YxeA family protein [Clostridium sp. Marseille-Q7071]
MKKFFSIICLIILMIVSFSILFLNPDKLTPENPAGKSIYYTVINNKSTFLNDNNRYEYILDSYDNKGNVKSLTFTASKELRENAYLELYVAPFRGVTYWQEIQYNDLPSIVQKIYRK